MDDFKDKTIITFNFLLHFPVTESVTSPKHQPMLTWKCGG
jgi:hypothetical protein